MLFPAIILVTSPDLSYTVCTIQLSKSVDQSQQALAGGLFQVSQRMTLYRVGDFD